MRFMKVTFDTITKEQIREVGGEDAALALGPNAGVSVDPTRQREARARCADLWNARHAKGE